MTTTVPEKKAGVIEVNGVDVHVSTLQAGDATNFPQPGMTVRLHYVATLADGSQFDSSRARDTPVMFRLGGGMVRRWLSEAARYRCHMRRTLTSGVIDRAGS